MALANKPGTVFPASEQTRYGLSPANKPGTVFPERTNPVRSFPRIWR
jgi:hypothetical protein